MSRIIYHSTFSDFLLLSSGSALTACTRVTDAGPACADGADSVLEEAVRQLDEYFGGRRDSFSLPLEYRGSDFFCDIWNSLRSVRAGQTVTYSQLAAMAGHPGAQRAAGSAMRANSLLLFIPCHRVVAAHSVGGFSAGLDLKTALLEFEKEAYGENRT